MQPPLFRLHTDAIIRRGDEILIMKRAMGVMTGAWYIAGGQLEAGELPDEGVRREIREETGLEVDDLRLFKIWRYRADESTPALAFSYTCSVPEGTEAEIDHEHSASRWVPARYYRERFLTDQALAALRDNPIAHELVTGVRDLFDAYLAQYGG